MSERDAGDVRSRIWYWLRAGISAAILAVVLTRISGGELVATVVEADPDFLLLAFLLSLGTYGAGALRLAMFVRFTGHGAHVVDMLRINLTALFYTLVVPGGNLTGAVVRIAKMRPLEIPIVPATAALVRDRVDTTLGMVLVGAVFLALDPVLQASTAALTLAVVAALAVVGALLILESPLSRGMDRLVEGIRFPVLNETVERLWEAVRRTGRAGTRAHLSAFTLSVGSHVLSTVAYLGLAHAVGIDLSLARIGWVRAGVLVVTMVPVSLGGIGLREAAFTLLLQPFDVAPETAVALSLVVFGVTVLALGVLGGVWNLSDTLRTGESESP